MQSILKADQRFSIEEDPEESILDMSARRIHICIIKDLFTVCKDAQGNDLFEKSPQKITLFHELVHLNHFFHSSEDTKNRSKNFADENPYTNQEEELTITGAIKAKKLDAEKRQEFFQAKQE